MERDYNIMDFIQNLCEGRLFGSGKSNLAHYSAKQITEMLYLQFLGIQILKYESGSLPVAQRYVRSTGNLTNFDYWRSGKNELYLMLHLIVGQYADEQRHMLKYGKRDARYLELTRLNKQNLVRFLRSVASGHFDEGSDRRFLMELERGLRITDSNLKNIRRVAGQWKMQSFSTKKTTLTRLLQLFRSKARRSELLPYLESLAIAMNMENRKLTAISNEPNPVAQKTPVKPNMAFLKNMSAGIASGNTAASILMRKKKD